MVLSGRSLTMEETPAEEVEPWGTKADFPRVLLDLNKSVYIYILLTIGVYIRLKSRRTNAKRISSRRGSMRCQADAATTWRPGVSLTGEYENSAASLSYRARSSMMETIRTVVGDA